MVRRETVSHLKCPARGVRPGQSKERRGEDRTERRGNEERGLEGEGWKYREETRQWPCHSKFPLDQGAQPGLLQIRQNERQGQACHFPVTLDSGTQLVSRLSQLRGFPREGLGSSSCPVVKEVPQKPPLTHSACGFPFSLLCPKVDFHIQEQSSTVRRGLLLKATALPVQCPEGYLSAAQPPRRAASTGVRHAWASFSRSRLCHRLLPGPASREEAEPFIQQVLAREAKNHRNPRVTKRRKQ